VTQGMHMMTDRTDAQGRGAETPPQPCRVLAVSSGGGHWVQLRRLAPAWQGAALVYASVAEPVEDPEADSETSDDEPKTPALRHHRLRDATRWDRIGLLVLAWQLARIVWQERPQLIVTTGAAPGLIALAWGRVMGARTVWIDSIANVDALSGAGRWARWVAHDWLTQWPHLARENGREGGPQYRGSVL